MKPATERLQEILNQTLVRGFPELRDKDVQIKWGNMDDAMMEVSALDPEGWRIKVDKSLKKTGEGTMDYNLQVNFDQFKTGSKEFQEKLLDMLKDIPCLQFSKNAMPVVNLAEQFWQNLRNELEAIVPLLPE